MPSYQYVYVMKDLTKAFPGGREVFKGITLAFLPGVKIGVLGINGAGKSTLMKIMAESTPISVARPGRPKVRASAIWNRNRSSIPTRRWARTSSRRSPI